MKLLERGRVGSDVWKKEKINEHRYFAWKCVWRNEFLDFFWAIWPCPPSSYFPFTLASAKASASCSRIFSVRFILAAIQARARVSQSFQKTISPKLCWRRSSPRDRAFLTTKMANFGSSGKKKPEQIIFSQQLSVIMIYERRYGWHKDVFILSKRFDDQRLRQWKSIVWNP